MCKSIFSRADRVIDLRSATRDSFRGRDIQTTLERLWYNLVRSYPRRFGTLTDKSSNIHDCCLPGGKWLCPWTSFQGSLRHHPRTFLSHYPSDVRIRFDTSRATRSEETIREGRSLGRICTILEPHKHLDPFPSPIIWEGAHHSEENCLLRIPYLCIRSSEAFGRLKRPTGCRKWERRKQWTQSTARRSPEWRTIGPGTTLSDLPNFHLIHSCILFTIYDAKIS